MKQIVMALSVLCILFIHSYILCGKKETIFPHIPVNTTLKEIEEQKKEEIKELLRAWQSKYITPKIANNPKILLQLLQINKNKKKLIKKLEKAWENRDQTEFEETKETLSSLIGIGNANYHASSIKKNTLQSPLSQIKFSTRALPKLHSIHQQRNSTFKSKKTREKK